MPSTSLYLDEGIIKTLAQYQIDAGERSAIVTGIIERYTEACRRELPRDWSRGEWLAMMDMLNATMIEPLTIAHLDHEVEDAIKLDHLDDKWHIDGAEFLGRVRALCYGARMAICDLAQRYWAAVSRGESQDELLPVKNLVLSQKITVG